MFDLEQFTGDCRAALAADSSHKLVREVVARAVADPIAVLKGIGEPKRPEVQKHYHAADLTILNVIWGPMMTIMPHNHKMWAVNGGDFFAAERSDWDPESLEESRYDVAKNMKLFEAANALTYFYAEKRP